MKNSIFLIFTLFAFISCTDFDDLPVSGSVNLATDPMSNNKPFVIGTADIFFMENRFYFPTGSGVRSGNTGNKLVIDDLLPDTYVISYAYGDDNFLRYKSFQIIAGKETKVTL